jgi:hypothetical protein
MMLVLPKDFEVWDMVEEIAVEVDVEERAYLLRTLVELTASPSMEVLALPRKCNVINIEDSPINAARRDTESTIVLNELRSKGKMTP